MLTLSRRELFELGAKVAAGAVVLTVPEVLYRAPWTAAAAAQTVSHVEDTFTAAVEAITTAASRPTAQWVIHEFDRALPPLPDQVAVTAAVTAILDARSMAEYAVPFAIATPDQRRDVLGDMVKDSDPAIRQVANQLLPFCAFGYWCDATMDEPAQPGGPTLPRWDSVGFPGPSHGYLETYTDGGPANFRPMTDFEP